MSEAAENGKAAGPVRQLVLAPTIAQRLVMLALACLLPACGLASFFAYRYAVAERAAIERAVLDDARTLAQLVDQEVAGMRSALAALGSSAVLHAGDYEAFYLRALAWRQISRTEVSLARPDRQQLVNTRVPWGTPLPRSAEGESFDRALATGEVTISGVFRGAVSGRGVVTISQALRNEAGEIFAVISLSTDADVHWLSLARKVPTPEGTSATLIDRNGVVVARWPENETQSTRPVPAHFAEAMTTAAQDGRVVPTVNLLGVPVRVAAARSFQTGWTATVSVPPEALDAPLWDALVPLAIGSFVVFGIGVVIAWHVGRRVTRPLHQLTLAARELGAGGEPKLPPLDLREADEIGGALVTAASDLRDRREALETLNRELEQRVEHRTGQLRRARDELQAINRNLEKIVASRVADLQAANDEIQRFAYIVSHDLRAPLVNIMGFTSELDAARGTVERFLATVERKAPELVDGDTRSAIGTDIAEAIGFIRASTAKMDRLIKAILTLSRAGRRNLAPEPIAMKPLCETLSASLAHQLDETGAEIVIEEMPDLVSDRLAIEQIFGNLVENAVKYLQQGRPGRIVLRGREEEGRVRYEIEDNGRGIEAKDFERVFDLFRRSGIQDRPGEGIGLAHVRALVRRLGGTIDLKSTFGEGTTFTVTLPKELSITKEEMAA